MMEMKDRQSSMRIVRPSSRILRRRLWLQVYLPVIIGFLVILGLALWFWLADVGAASAWGDIALILIAIPAFVIGILFFGLLAAMTYGVIRACGWIPGPAGKAQEIVARISSGAGRIGDILTRPVMMPKAAMMAIRRVIYLFTTILSKD
jgi:hypothetical protein